MENVLISPSILNSDFGDLRGVIKELDRCKVDRIHIDVMDGHFVPNITIGPQVISSIRSATKIPFEAHLMIKNPHDYIKQFVDAGSDIVIVHHEANDAAKSLELIEKCGAKPGIAINPGTAFETAKGYLPKVDTFLVMSVHPGFGGQKFIPEALDKIRLARKYAQEKESKVTISVDGGINLETGSQAVSAGAGELVAGSAIFASKNIPGAIEQFRALSKMRQGL